MWLESGPLKLFIKSKISLCAYQKQLERTGYIFLQQYSQTDGIPVNWLALFFLVGIARRAQLKLAQETCSFFWILNLNV